LANGVLGPVTAPRGGVGARIGNPTEGSSTPERDGAASEAL
jgi:hypothetical protein